MSNRNFLDIDDTILTKNLILPGNTPKGDNLIESSDSKPFFIIQPKPGICVKTKASDGGKVFLNICTSEKIHPPEDISNAKLDEIFEQENPQFLIPMAIGREKIVTDKGGSSCVAVDVAINTKYFEKCQRDKHFLVFTIAVTIEAVSEKINRTLAKIGFVILQNRKVMGELQQQRIENREPRLPPQAQKPLIEEIKVSGKKENVNLSENIPAGTINNEALKYVLLKQPLEGVCTNLIGLFDMPKGTTSNEVEVLLDQDRVVVAVDKVGLTYDLWLPHIINVSLAKSYLDKDLRVLKVVMPVYDSLKNIHTP